jgi:hypothetical protein
MMPVRSRVSWGAIAAGAMVAVAVYFLLTLLGVAVGLEVSANRSDVNLGAGAALWSILTLLLAMFIGGWATSRLAVGETKLEAILYGVILWGVLFIGMFWLFGVGVRVGFGAMMGIASGATAVAAEVGDSGGGANAGVIDQLAQRYNKDFSDPKFVEDLKALGVADDVATKVQDKVKARVEDLRENPDALASELREDPDVKQAAEEIRRTTKSAVWYSLLGIVVSMATVILGSLIGSGDIPVPIAMLGVRRVPVQRP